MIKNVRKMNVQIREGKWFTLLEIFYDSNQKLIVNIIDDVNSNNQGIKIIKNYGNMDEEAIIKELQQCSLDYDAKKTIQKLKSLNQLTFSKQHVKIKKELFDEILIQLLPEEEMRNEYKVRIKEMNFKVRFDGEKIIDILYHFIDENEDMTGLFISKEHVSIKGLFAFERSLETYMQHITRLRKITGGKIK